VQQFGDDGFSTVEETITRQTYVASEFARDGEQAIDTLTRLATSLQGVNSMFDTLGWSLLESSLAGGNLASQLADVAGGMDKLQANAATYFQNFYTEEERRATGLRQVQEQLLRLGVESIPQTAAQFRALVESYDPATEAGQKMIASLLALSGAFAAVTGSADETAAAAQRAAEELSNAARQRADSVFARLQQLMGEQIGNWEALASEAKSIFRLASSAATSLRGGVDSTRLADAASASAYIDQALIALRATGALPDADTLRDAIAAARGGLDMSQ